jgi:hypothetical protein
VHAQSIRRQISIPVDGDDATDLSGKRPPKPTPSVFVKRVEGYVYPSDVRSIVVATQEVVMALRKKSVSAMKKLLAKRDAWNPYFGFPSLADAEQERRTHIAILERGDSRASAQLAKLLRKAREGMRADTACCPVRIREFQISFVSAALAIHEAVAWKGAFYTLLSPDGAVDVGMLHTIDWKRRHASMRKFVTWLLGESAVVVGMAAVEYDKRRNEWQLLYHLMIYCGSTESFYQKVDARYYWIKRYGPGPIVRTRPAATPWFRNMSLAAFGKMMETDGRGRQIRLNDRLSREYLHYLTDHTPTSSIFCINCDIVNRRVTRQPAGDVDDHDEYRRPSKRFLPTPLVPLC